MIIYAQINTIVTVEVAPTVSATDHPGTAIIQADVTWRLK